MFKWIGLAPVAMINASASTSPRSLHFKRSIGEIHTVSTIKFNLRSKPFGLFLKQVAQFRAAHTLRKSRIIFQSKRSGGLAAQFCPVRTSGASSARAA